MSQKSLEANAPLTGQVFGRIINLSFVMALVGLQRRTPYSTAKAAIAGLTRGLALENGRHGITVNAVAQGYVLTDVLKEKMRLGTRSMPSARPWAAGRSRRRSCGSRAFSWIPPHASSPLQLSRWTAATRPTAILASRWNRLHL
jgi:NAD(P)-dependent dehydrogenase (short-subunit alcohol dehydrogenase family)